MKRLGAFLLVCVLGISILLCIQASASGRPQDSLPEPVPLAPESPMAWNVELVGTFPIPSPYKVMDVSVYGDYAYVAAGGMGMRVVNVTNPAAPYETGNVWTHNGNGVVEDWPYAFVGGGDQFFSIDVSDPEAPGTVGTVNPVNTLGRLALDGVHAYVAEGTGGLGVVDVSDRANPDHIALLNTPGSAEDLAISGNHAFVADSGGGLRIIDITTPASPSEVGHYTWTDQPAFGVAARGGYVYVTTQNNGGLRVLDVSVPESPVEVGACEMLGHGYGVEVEGDYAYVAFGLDGLRIINIADPTKPWLVGSYDTSLAWSLDLDGGLIYLADQAGGMLILRFLGFSGYTISGQVLDDLEVPLPGVTVSAGEGLSAVTNESGVYTIADLPPDTYTLTPSLEGWTFDPATRQVEVPPDATGQDFFGTPTCPDPLESVTISGPTEGVTDTLYAFNAIVSPADATEPLAYEWSPEPDLGQGTASASYSWDIPSIYSITVEAENCGGIASATHTILIGPGTAQIVEPDLGATLVYTDAQGSPTVIQVPPGAVTGTVTLAYLPTHAPVPPPGMHSVGHDFVLEAYKDGVHLQGLTFDPPFTVTINYTDTQMIGLVEKTLGLWFLDGATWSTEGISVTAHMTLTNQLEATCGHLSTFALLGEELRRVYLPLILRAP